MVKNIAVTIMLVSTQTKTNGYLVMNIANYVLKTQVFLFFGPAIKSRDLGYRDIDPARNYGNVGVLQDMLISRLSGIDSGKSI